MLADVIDRVADALDLFGVLIRDLYVELFLKPHDKFNGIERVSAEVINEARVGRHLAFVYAELVDDYRFHSLLNRTFCHLVALLKNVRQT